MHNLERKIEAILFFKNEPVSFKNLAKLVEVDEESVKASVRNLQEFYRERGIVIVTDGEEVNFGTSHQESELIETVQKEEFSRELGRAGLETLSIVLYKGPISRREIDYIRGVNSGFILRNLLVRGLVERTDPSTALGAGRSYVYKPTLKLLEHLGITRIEDLPEYKEAFKKIEEFAATASIEEDNA